MICLRVAGRPSEPVDLALIRSAARLSRAGGSLWVYVAAADRNALVRDLALAGLGAIPDDPPLTRSGDVPAIGNSLRPVSELALDVLILRRIPLSEATRRALGARFARSVPTVRRRRHEDCRALLSGADEQAWWERRAWLGASDLRRAGARATLRPIVFDRAALDRSRPGGVIRASDGAITRWAFA